MCAAGQTNAAYDSQYVNSIAPPRSSPEEVAQCACGALPTVTSFLSIPLIWQCPVAALVLLHQVLQQLRYLQVLKSDKAPTSTHYMVVRAAGPPAKRIILYNYIPSRTREALKQLLVRPEGPYRYKLLTDGLEHYDDICQELQLLHFGCWHMRGPIFSRRARFSGGAGRRKYGDQFLGPLVALPPFSYVAAGATISYLVDCTGGVTRSVEQREALAQ
jgi:hypothetical protein